MSNQDNFYESIKNKLNNKNFIQYSNGNITKPDYEYKYYLLKETYKNALADFCDEDVIIKLFLYVTLLLLDALDKGINYKLKLHPNYSFIVYKSNVKVDLLGFKFKSIYEPLFNSLVTRYSYKILDHEEYYENTVIEEKDEDMEINIVNNIKEIIEKVIESNEEKYTTLSLCSHETDHNKFIELLYFYSCEYDLEKEIIKTKNYIREKGYEEEEITEFKDLINLYVKFYDNFEMLSYLIVGWEYPKDILPNKEKFYSFLDKIIKKKDKDYLSEKIKDINFIMSLY